MKPSDLGTAYEHSFTLLMLNWCAITENYLCNVAPVLLAATFLREIPHTTYAEETLIPSYSQLP